MPLPLSGITPTDSIYGNYYGNSLTTTPFSGISTSTFNFTPTAAQDSFVAAQSSCYASYKASHGGIIYDPSKPQNIPDFRGWSVADQNMFWSEYFKQQREYSNAQTEQYKAEKEAKAAAEAEAKDQAEAQAKAEQEAQQAQAEAIAQAEEIQGYIDTAKIGVEATGAGYVGYKYYTGKGYSRINDIKLFNKTLLKSKRAYLLPQAGDGVARAGNMGTRALRSCGSKMLGGAKVLTKGCVYIGVGLSAFDIYNAYQEGGAKAAVKQTAKTAAGFAGAWAGAKIGALAGSWAGPVGIAIGGFIGGAVGWIVATEPKKFIKGAWNVGKKIVSGIGSVAKKLWPF